MSASAMKRPVDPKMRIRRRSRLLVALAVSSAAGDPSTVLRCCRFGDALAVESAEKFRNGGSSEPHAVQKVSDGAGITRQLGHARHASIGMMSSTSAAESLSIESGPRHAAASAVLAFLLNTNTPSPAACTSHTITFCLTKVNGPVDSISRPEGPMESGYSCVLPRGRGLLCPGRSSPGSP